jgi:hypothetical protein
MIALGDPVFDPGVDLIFFSQAIRLAPIRIGAGKLPSLDFRQSCGLEYLIPLAGAKSS